MLALDILNSSEIYFGLSMVRNAGIAVVLRSLVLKPDSEGLSSEGDHESVLQLKTIFDEKIYWFRCNDNSLINLVVWQMSQ